MNGHHRSRPRTDRLAGLDSKAPASRQPLLYVVALVVGVVLAIVAAMLLNGGAGGLASATSSPGPAGTGIALASGGPSPEGTPGDTAAAGLEPTAGASLSPTAAATHTPAKTPTPTGTPRPTATPNTNPAIASYSVPSVADCSLNGGSISIHIKWSILRATGVELSIDGGLYNTYPGLTGDEYVPFGCSTEVDHHTYTLRTIGGTGPAATSTKTVKRGAPKIITFSLPQYANCPIASGSLGITFTWEVKYATGVTLDRDGQTYADHAGQKSGSTTIVYDCSKDTQTFVLRTLQTYGTEATKQRIVTRTLPT
jgi:hypothetical protein